MIATVLDTRTQEPCDRLEWWDETLKSFGYPLNHMKVDPRDFYAKITLLDMGAVQLSLLSYSSLLLSRTPGLIRRNDPELTCLTLTRQGTQGLDHHGRQARFGGGDLLFFSTSHPYAGWTRADRGSIEMIMLSFPQTALPFPAAKNNSLFTVPLPATIGTGALLARFITTLADEYASFSDQDATRLGTISMDLIGAFVAGNTGEPQVVTPEGREQMLMYSIDTYIENNLGDARLTPTTIAAVHHISVRQLHRLFEQHEFTVSAWIRKRRLNRCHRDLAEPQLAHLPVGVVAASWGFPHPEEFSRAFRSAYGMTPTDHRRQALRQK